MEIPRSCFFLHIASAHYITDEALEHIEIADDARAQRYGRMMVLLWKMRSLTARADLYIFFFWTPPRKYFRGIIVDKV
jgi:hypothetical protein